MADGFTQMIDRAGDFFTALAANNTRDWFDAHKAQYTDDIRNPATLMADLFAEDLARITGQPQGPKVFRIHRDVRFSKDKTPYNTHLHILWRPPGQAPTPAWFFGTAPDYTMMGMGLPGLEGAALTRYRTLVDRDGDDLSDALTQAADAVGATIADWGAAPLKRVPKPYDVDHPHADLLRRKGLVLNVDFPPGWRDRGVLPTLAGISHGLLPVWRILARAFPA